MSTPHSAIFTLAKESAIELALWVRRNGFKGYDPYDLPGYLFDQRSHGNPVPEETEAELRRLDVTDPKGLREQLGILPAINAKAMGLLLGAFSILDQLDRGWTEEMKSAAEWLDSHGCTDFGGKGWGYPFNWESYQVIPANTPTGVNSCHVGDGFRRRFLATGDEAWLTRCREIAEFLLHGLNCDFIENRGRCFSYTPIDFFHVNNANLGTAEFLVWTGLQCDCREYIQAGIEAVDFSLSDMKGKGTLTYWARGYEPNAGLVGFMDHYHSAAELRSLLRLSRLLPDHEKIRTGFDRYFDFYLKEMFDEQSRPILRPGFSWLPFDIHAGAEAAYILGEALDEHPLAEERLTAFLPWFIRECRNPDGSFVHRIEEADDSPRIRPFAFLRWGQAWTLRGLCAVIEATRGDS